MLVNILGGVPGERLRYITFKAVGKKRKVQKEAKKEEIERK